jgi:hypothetical protein
VTPKAGSTSRLRYVGTWLSLVEHSLGVRGVGSSNLPVPTISIEIPLKGFTKAGKNCRFMKRPNLDLAERESASTNIACEASPAQESHSAIQICPCREDGEQGESANK